MTSLRRRLIRAVAATVAPAIVLAIAACQPANPSATPDPLEGVVVGCGTIEPVACRAAAAAALGFLPAGSHPFDIEVMLLGCPGGGACPPTAEARKGSVIVEFTGGREPVTYFLTGPAPRNEPITGTFSDAVTPGSSRVNGAGPFPFELGPCGLIHAVDFDGSFWVPLGPFDADDPAVSHAAAGSMRLLGINIAEFRAAAGFSARLTRFPGAKRLFACSR